LTSDSSPEFLDFTMKATLGPEWHSVFDLVVANAKKPLFYHSESPFYSYEYNKSSKTTSKSITTVKEL
jgi:hypothetical protein